MPMTPFSQNLNHGRFETWTDKPEMDFFHVHQVHGNNIVSVETLPAEADGILSSWNDLTLPLAIKTADCLPVVIEGETGVVFLHAGWKGLQQKILTTPEVKLIKPLKAFIGPSIQKCCFEVTQEFKHHFLNNQNFITRDEKLFFNLQQEALDQLKGSFPEVEVIISPLCTACNVEFNSYRRDKTIKRNWNLYIKG